MTKDIRARVERYDGWWWVSFTHLAVQVRTDDFYWAILYANNVVGQARKARDMFND